MFERKSNKENFNRSHADKNNLVQSYVHGM